MATEILGAVNNIRKEFQRLLQNPQRMVEFTSEVDKLETILGTAQVQMSGTAEELVRSGVKEVKDTLNAVAEHRGGIWRWVTTAPGDARKLDEVQEKLKILTTQVVVVDSILQLKEELKKKRHSILQLKNELKKKRPRVYNETFELPECRVGLHRADEALQFLEVSQNLAMRVIGIYGLAGIGKTTLLDVIWENASSTAPFAARAHVQIGPDIDDKGICKLQSVILRQLSGGQDLIFTAPGGGRARLSKHLRELSSRGKPVFLAIDNVFKDEDLTRLLPASLSKDIPASSVIVITCRFSSVVDDLLRLCKLDRQEDESQIYLLPPGCLSEADSKKLFAECGGLSDDANADLLDSLVPLCGGFPLALTSLGRVFVDRKKREREEWELIKEQMERLDGDDKETALVIKALQVTYDQLSEKCQAAFCEVVMCFYGWNWARVERILGVSVLKNLKESCLISEAEHWWSTCNQSELREGYGMHVSYDPELDQRVVAMHDLTLKFGKARCASLLRVTTFTEYPAMRDALQRLEASKLRHLILTGYHGTMSSIRVILEKTTILQTLYVSCSLKLGRNCLLKASSYKDILSTDERPSLHFLRLEGCQFSRSIIEMKLSSETREVYLDMCNDVEQLPCISLHKLEVLRIEFCTKFTNLPSSVREWHNLKFLLLTNCPRLTSISAELGCLKKLCDLVIVGCVNLETLPTLSCPLQNLHLVNIPIANLELEKAACSRLQNVHLGIRSLKSLPSSIWNASSLKTMFWYMGGEVEKPLPAIGSASSSLQSLRLRSLKLVELPEYVGNLVVLRELNLDWCRSLKRLSPSIGNLTRLESLSLNGCRRLKKLPPNVGNAASLEYLNLRDCENLVELPDEVGKLTALTELDLQGCRRLKKLPPSIGNARSLQTLILKMAFKLVELPEEVGKLTALKILNLNRCIALKGLPPAIGNVVSLQELRLKGCKSLVKLPDEVGKLVLLKELHLSWCKSLKELPSAIGNVKALQVLNLHGCVNLVDLPDEVEQLANLTDFCLFDCKNLKSETKFGSLPPSTCCALRYVEDWYEYEDSYEYEELEEESYDEEGEVMVGISEEKLTLLDESVLLYG